MKGNPMSEPIVDQYEPIRRGWFPYAMVAKHYLGISPDVLLRAIKSGQLKAYKKPLTRGRREGSTSDRCSIFCCLADVDEYIRTCWEPAHD